MKHVVPFIWPLWLVRFANDHHSSSRYFIYVLTGIIACLPMLLQAQYHCGTTHALPFGHRGHFEPQAVQENRLQDWIQGQAGLHKGSATPLITIPVVVHVIHNGEPVGVGSNISDARILQQLAILNEDFRGNNADSLLPSHPFYGLAADTRINFCLAQRDPNGYATTGITRKQGGQTSYVVADNHKIKSTYAGGRDNWPSSQYLNIWVVCLSATETVAGWSTNIDNFLLFPENDGVVVRYDAFGVDPGNSSGRNKGRTLTHEAGHWLGLIHPWGPTSAACGDDLVADTPPAEGENTGCKTFPWRPNNACGSDANGEMFMNFMDYGNDGCLVMFSAGQAVRMMATINTVRAGLLTANGCTPSVLANPLVAATRWYVDPAASGNGNGTTWANAATHLQAALDHALAFGVQEIWVKAGTYLPATDGNRLRSFRIPSGVKVYGGFAGTENVLADRDPALIHTTNATVLSGDLLGNDAGFTNNAENSAAIVKILFAPATTRFDGFVVKGGNSNLDFESGRGAGILNFGSGAGNSSNPVIANCLITNNAAYGGAGLFNQGAGGNATMTLTNCVFSRNTVTVRGAALFNDAVSGGICSPVITHCTFEDNTSDENGGAVFNEGGFGGNAQPVFTNCSFSRNSTNGFGGAVYNWAEGSPSSISSPAFYHCSFAENTSTDGGGVMLNLAQGGKSSPVFKNCVFLHNQSDFYGGAFINQSSNNGVIAPAFTNCSFFRNNIATPFAAGAASCIYNYAAASSIHLVFDNCILYENGPCPLPLSRYRSKVELVW